MRFGQPSGFERQRRLSLERDGSLAPGASTLNKWMRYFVPCAVGAVFFVASLSAQVPPPWIHVPPPREE